MKRALEYAATFWLAFSFGAFAYIEKELTGDWF
jgi:hypothetical protein